MCLSQKWTWKCTCYPVWMAFLLKLIWVSDYPWWFYQRSLGELSVREKEHKSLLPTGSVNVVCFFSSRISKYIFLTLSPLPADRAELRKITTFKENTIYNEHTVSSHEDKQPWVQLRFHRLKKTTLFPSLFGNYNRPTDQPTDLLTNRHEGS